MSHLELNLNGSAQNTPPAGESSQPGLAPGSWWTCLSPKSQARIIAATVREALAREIVYNEIRRDGREPYRHVRIEENGTEYELNFGPEATEAQIMAEPLKYWRII